ncbi:MAG: pre-peptidase C-terminal domain-containing protein [Phycisphaerales bacterium]
MNSTNKLRARGLIVLAATWGLIASTAWGAAIDLSSGVPVTGLSGAAGSEKMYKIEVPGGQDLLEISTSGGSGDVDLYVRKGAEPTLVKYDYRPYKVGNEEAVSIEKPGGGPWYILLRGYGSYSGVTLSAACSGKVETRDLISGVPVDGLSDATGSQRFFKIEVPAEQVGLEIKISGGKGDADLYVRKGDAPTTAKYDYRPYVTGNNETVSVKNPGDGTWYVMIQAKKAYDDVTLVANLTGGVPILTNDVPVTKLAGQPGTEMVYRIDVPVNQTSLEIRMSGGTGDADLFVKFGSRPTMTDYDYRPYVTGNNESVVVDNPAAGAWFVVVRGFSAFADVTLKATYGELFTLKDGVPVPNLAGAGGSERFFKIDVPANQAHLLFEMSGGSGNADMYIRRGSKPTTAAWDYRPIQPGNTESISIGNPAAGTWYVMLKGTAAYNGVTLSADYQANGTATTLKNNEPVTGISGEAKDELFYKIEVPAGQESLQIRMSGGTGDADLYVKRGAQPKTTDYDYRPYLIGNEETVDVRSPEAGTWYVMIRGYQAFSGITLVAQYAGTAVDDSVVLQSGKAVSGISGAANSETFYKIEVPAGQVKLEIALSGGTGDADLYVRKGSRPTTKEWDYRPYVIGNNEKISVDKPQEGTWYVMLRGQTVYASVTLKATYSAAAEQIAELRSGTPIPGLSGAAGSEMFFKIEVPAGQASLTIAVTGGTGDVDLYVRKGAKPTQTSYDYRPYLIGNEEKVEVAEPAAATWYVMLLGYQAYAGVTLQGQYVPVQDKVTVLVNGTAVKGLAGAAGNEKFFSIDVPAGQDSLTVELAGGTGNADLYVRKGSKPTTSDWDFRSDRAGNQDKVEIARPQAATWFVLVRGQQAYTGVSLTAAYVVSQPAGNDFASDPDCVALWQFEDKAFVNDSIGSNFFENHGASLEATDVREGAGCADFRVGQGDWMSIDDDHLSANFPTRSGGKNADLSVCFWMKPRSFPYGSTMISKFLPTTDDRSWRLYLGGGIDQGYMKLALGTGSGGDAKVYDFNGKDQQFPKGHWYHVAFTYKNADKSYHIRVWDDTAGALVCDSVGKATAAMPLTNSPLVLGGIPLLSEYYDGLLDEVAVFKDVLTTDEIDSIRQGQYSLDK